MNVRKDFLIWLAEKGTYKDVNLEIYIDKYLGYLQLEIFEVDDNFLNIEEIKNSITSNHNDLKTNNEFLKFNKSSGKGIPSAILGKDNYFQFLDEFRSNINFKQTIALLKKDIGSSLETKDLFEFYPPTSSWAWIKDSYGIIGNKICHYEIGYNKKTKAYTVDVHFEGKKAEQTQFEQILNNLPKDLGQFPWRIVPCIRYKDALSASSYNLIEKLKSQLYYIETTIGEQLRDIIKSNNSDTIKQTFMSIKHPLNQILFGPPGTGKTYNTINKALEIIDPTYYSMNKHDRISLQTKFKELQYNPKTEKGQIAFITFHQSMTYEDFIEGIKPIMNDEKAQEQKLEYEISPGLFKRISKTAEFKESNFYEKIEWLKKECSEADAKDSIEINTGNSIFNISYRGGKTFKVKPKKSTKKESDYPASIENIKKLFEGETDNGMYNPTYVKGILQFLISKGLKKENATNKPYVLIIDEINRGNVSQIFGELITLIEDDKRIGKEEALEVVLPYSKEKFGVPSNLYIIGTMNTADRSVEALDTALRRRFHFEEMPPNPELIATEGRLKEQNGVVESVELPLLLSIINKRIEKLLDKDHQIGHSYFMSVTNLEELKSTFQNKIIPLLQEYFFGDYGKIGLVIGKGFFEISDEQSKDIFAYFDGYDASEFAERSTYNLKNILNMTDDNFCNALSLVFNK